MCVSDGGSTREMVTPANNSDEMTEMGFHTAELSVVLQHIVLFKEVQLRIAEYGIVSPAHISISESCTYDRSRVEVSRFISSSHICI